MWRGPKKRLRNIKPGQRRKLLTRRFRGEPKGLYFFTVVIMSRDKTQGATPIDSFVLGGFQRLDTSPYVRIDSAVLYNLGSAGQWLHLRGKFFPALPQFIVLSRKRFWVNWATYTQAWVQIVGAAIKPGIYDLTLLVHNPVNAPCDSAISPGILKVFIGMIDNPFPIPEPPKPPPRPR